MKNTTNDKGDVGVAKVMADLTSKGIKIALPSSHHLPFDLIAISPDYELSRLSIKYCDGEKLQLALRTISACSKQVIRKVNFDFVDAYAVYSPITGECYYVPKSELLKNKSLFTLRISEPKNNCNVRRADNYKDVNVIFGCVGERIKPGTC